ncbi:PIN domain-containing protein [Parapusillimonas granuli]|uniref:PIN domain-containing protein n=1 Tax=Parapusillimonas granuli TaxID=380911 RepID=A0A853FZP7_9BURK|nr:PIN domain-containing protein [Parapusillimonas granuli]MBB5216782.1 hypothetical protein [Parapusillimonas granuli]MEB2400111.1 PIN domain-containing protein [Alcaligenaceae bacterium]NYT51574.1 PIN domain-containing protein [Parapusillimonas granuli]
MNKRVPDILVLDTCVLISNVLRRGLLHLAGQACFRPVWSPVIGDEWRRNAARLWGVPDEDVHAQWRELQQAFPEADQGGVEAYKTGLRRSDPKDWHVVAAGRAALARWPGLEAGILTRNTRDFNRAELRGMGLGLFDPDEFLLRCWQQYPDATQGLLSALPAYALAPHKDLEPLETILRRERLFRVNKLVGSP